MRKVTARSRRRADGEVRTIYRVDGEPVEDAEAVEAALGRR